MSTSASGRAFVPGHVTIFFSPRWADDPERSGSIGAGITLSDGVTVAAEPADRTTVRLNGELVHIDPVSHVLDALSRSLRVRVETPLPVGAGFGVSGAMALGTALVANYIFDESRSENELIRLAHRAEVRAGTGLGDVVAQARGGIPIRLEPGAPGYGTLDGIPAISPIEYLSFGGIETPEVLAANKVALEVAGASALEELRGAPTLATLFDVGWEFAQETGLITSRVEEAVRAVRDSGGMASMAMLGRTVVALGSGLSDAGYDATGCETHPPGATLR